MKKAVAVLIAVTTTIALVVAIVAWNDAPPGEPRSLRDTMLHAVDRYSSIEAHYAHRFLGTPADSTERQLTVDVVREPGVGAAATLTRVDGVVVEYVTDGRKVVEHDLRTDEYTSMSVAPPAGPRRASSIWHRLRLLFQKGKDVAEPIVLRQEGTELPLGWVSTAIFPQEWILGTYDVAQVTDLGHQEMLGRSTQKLEVVAPNGRTFVINVDKETGVLLRIEIAHSQQVLEIIEATSLRVNDVVDRARFTLPDLTGKRVRFRG